MLAVPVRILPLALILLALAILIAVGLGFSSTGRLLQSQAFRPIEATAPAAGQAGEAAVDAYTLREGFCLTQSNEPFAQCMAAGIAQ